MTKRNAFSFFALAIFAIAVSFFAWKKWSDSSSESSRSKPTGAWVEQGYNTGNAPAIVIFGDSQLGGLRSADAKVVNRKLDFALDHRGYAIETELKKINCTTAPSRLDISNALSRIGYANTLNSHQRMSEFNEGGLLRSPEVFIASQPGSIVSDYYAMSKSLISEKRKPAIAIIAINPRSFLDNGLTCPGDSEYFRYFARRTTFDSDVYNAAYPDLQNKLNFLINVFMPSQVNQVAVGQFIFLPDDQQNYHDRLLYPLNFSLSAKKCEHQIWFLNKTLELYNTMGIKTIVVSLPLLIKSDSIVSLKRLQDELHAPIAEACASKDFKYFDLTTDKRFLESDFLDPVHLSQSGGEKIASILSQQIARAE